MHWCCTLVKNNILEKFIRLQSATAHGIYLAVDVFVLASNKFVCGFWGSHQRKVIKTELIWINVHDAKWLTVFGMWSDVGHLDIIIYPNCQKKKLHVRPRNDRYTPMHLHEYTCNHAMMLYPGMCNIPMAQNCIRLWTRACVHRSNSADSYLLASLLQLTSNSQNVGVCAWHRCSSKVALAKLKPLGEGSLPI